MWANTDFYLEVRKLKQINQSIVIDAKVKATLEGMSQVVADLNKGLREGATKIDLTKGIGNTVSKQITPFRILSFCTFS